MAADNRKSKKVLLDDSMLMKVSGGIGEVSDVMCPHCNVPMIVGVAGLVCPVCEFFSSTVSD